MIHCHSNHNQRRRGGKYRGIVALAVAGCLGCGGAIAETLPFVATKVLNEHPDIQSAQALFRAADHIVSQARSSFFPTVGVQHEVNNTEFQLGSSVGRPPPGKQERTTNRTDAVVRWNLFNGLADWYQVKASSGDRQAAQEETEEAMERIALLTTESYLEVLRLEEQLKNARDNAEELEKLFKDVQTNASAGRVPEADVHQAQARYIRAKNELSVQQGNYNVAVVTYRELTKLEPKDLQLPTLDMKDADHTLNELLDRAATTNHRYQAALERINARDAQISVATAAFSPKVDLNFSYLLNLEGSPPQFTISDRSTSVMFSYLQPIGGAQYFRRKEIIERKNQAQADADSIAIKLKTELGSYLRELAQARQIAPHLSQYRDSQAQVVSAYGLQYDAGRRTLFDLLQVRQELYDSQTTQTTNAFTQLALLAQIEQLLGGLRSTLGVKVDHPTLEPSLLPDLDFN